MSKKSKSFSLNSFLALLERNCNDKLDTYKKIPEITNQLLIDSHAIVENKTPPVWILKVARHLNVDVTTAFRNSNLRSTIYLADDNRWKVSLSTKRRKAERYQLAHELGHAFLYSPKNIPDPSSWNSRNPSLEEEIFCHIFARWVIAPQILMGEILNRPLIEGIMACSSKFHLSLEDATLRLLDCYSLNENFPKCVIFWTQSSPKERFSFTGVEKALQVKCNGYFAELLYKLIPQQSKERLLSDFFESLQNRDPYGELSRNYIYRSKELLDLINCLLNYSRCERARLRDDSIQFMSSRPKLLWSKFTYISKKSEFIHLKNTSIRPRTITWNAFHERSTRVYLSGKENISIGSLKGMKYVECYSWGDRKHEQRKAIQVIWDTQPTRILDNSEADNLTIFDPILD